MADPKDPITNTDKEKGIDKDKERKAVPIKKSKGSYQKEIVAHLKLEPETTDSKIFKISHGGYYFFEIEVNKKANFSLEVLKASNKDATRENVYWIGQDFKNFGTRKFLSFKNVENKLPLHEFLNSLNEGTKFGGPTLKNGQPNPNYDANIAHLHTHTLASTNYVGKNYVATNPYLSNKVKRELENNVYFGNLAYKTDKKGEGIWIEGINFKAEFKSQGAFVIAVGEPEILNFYAEKRTQSERQVDALGVQKKDCDAIEGNLIYGDVIDLHFNLHNVVDYIGNIEIFCDGKSMDRNNDGNGYVRGLNLEQYQSNENPSLNYNIAFIDELVADIRWADKSGHKEGKDDEDSLKEYKIKLTLEPLKRRALDGRPYYERKTLTREISFTINYTSNFSLDEHEPQYVAQVVKVKQTPLVSQSYEMCKYTELKMEIEGQDAPVTILQEKENGALVEMAKDNKTPYYNIIAGNKANTKEITLTAASSVADCVNEEKHINNVFNTKSILPYNYKTKFSDTILGRVLSDVYNTNIFEEVQPFSIIGSASEQQLKFKAAFPYNAMSNTTFLLRYLTMQLNPVPLDISVQSCRYVRTPKIWIHPDVKWAMHLNYDVDEKNRLYFENKNVPLVEGHGSYMSYVAEGVDWINEKVKPLVEGLLKYSNNKQLKESWQNVQNIVEDFVETSNTIIGVGFHAVYDGEEVKNYAKIQPYKAILSYQIFQVALASLAIDILLIYLTRGKMVSPSAKKLAKAAKKISKFKDKYDLDFITPKVTMNAGIYKIQQTAGQIATIFEYNLKADPFIGIETEFKFAPEQLPGALKKFELKAVVKGVVKFDINIKYNTYTKEFSLTDNATQQEGGGGNALKQGDIIQMEGLIGMEVEAEGKLKKEFKSSWFFVPEVKTTIHGKIKLQTAAGVTRRLGIDNSRGPFIEDTLFFDGLQGEYFQKVTVEVKKRKGYDSNPNNETKPIEKFGYGTASFGRTYLFEMFSLASK